MPSPDIEDFRPHHAANAQKLCTEYYKDRLGNPRGPSEKRAPSQGGTGWWFPIRT